MRFFLKLMLSVFFIFYPIIVFWGIKYFSIRYLGLLLILALCLRFLFAKASRDISWIVATSLGIVFCIIGMLSESLVFMQLYPILVSMMLFGFFAYSLTQPLSLVTRIAMKMSKQPLPAYAVVYTRYVTMVWSVFFIINAITSLSTLVWGSLNVWTLYNGFVSYMLVAVLTSIEFIVRLSVRYFYEHKEVSR